MKQTHSAGGIVLNQKKQVLIVNQKGKAWSLPKGHIEQGEDALIAAKREIFEESGITQLTFVKELGTYQRHKINRDGGDDISEHKTITLFLFTTDQEKLQPQDPDNPEARWVDKDKVAELLTHRKDKEFFLSVIDTLG